MNENIKETFELIQTLVIGWLAIYGMFSFCPLDYPKTIFDLTFGVWFLVIAAALLGVMLERIKGENKDE